MGKHTQITHILCQNGGKTCVQTYSNIVLLEKQNILRNYEYERNNNSKGKCCWDIFGRITSTYSPATQMTKIDSGVLAHFH